MTLVALTSNSPPATHLFKSNLAFEGFLMFYLMICCFLQNINLYKTNVRSLDLDLLAFTLVFLARRLSWLLFKKVLDNFKNGVASSKALLNVQVLGVFALLCLAGLLCWSLFKLIQRSSIFDCLFLLYPLVLYLSLFGFTVEPALHQVSFKAKKHYVQLVPVKHSKAVEEEPTNSCHGDGLEGSPNSFGVLDTSHSYPIVGNVAMTTMPNISSREDSKLVKRRPESVKQYSRVNHMKGKVVLEKDHILQGYSLKAKRRHNPDSLSNGVGQLTDSAGLTTLPATPEEVRTEVEKLLDDSVGRMKQLIFSSLLSTYYTTFVPLLFVEAHIVYDKWWCLENGVIIWTTCFVTLGSQLLPPQHCAALHHIALHCLGLWNKDSSVSGNIPEWSGSVAWAKDTIVGWDGDFYRGEGNINVAIPGNSAHEYFYHIFHYRETVYTWLLAMEGVSILLLLLALAKSHYWHQYISAAILLGINYFIFYKLFLNRLTFKAGPG